VTIASCWSYPCWHPIHVQQCNSSATAM
jgi:hypothetical protein